jgi:hypothetical protein
MRIQIRTQEGKQRPTNKKKVRKIHVLKSWIFSFDGGRLLLVTGRSSWRSKDKFLAIFDLKNDITHQFVSDSILKS